MRDIAEKIKDYNIQFKKNQIKNNKLKEEGEHSTSGSSKTQITSTKSNDSTPRVCKIFNKNDNTPLENEDLFKITPHFINEKPINDKINIQLNFNLNNSNNKNKKTKFARPLTPNINLIRKSSGPNYQINENKINSKISNNNGNLIYECEKIQTNEKIEKNMNLDSKLNKKVIKTDTNIKGGSFSSSKNKMLNNYNNLHTDSMNEKNYNKNIQINNYISNKPVKNIYNSINNSNSINKIPFSYNNNKKNIQSKKVYNNYNYLERQRTQRKNSTKITRINSNANINKSLNNNKKYNNNFFCKNNYDEVEQGIKLKPFKSDNKITIVKSKVNNEINNLFNGLSDNIVKDPEIHNKIECLLKDIKDIQQVVNRKTQSHFRPKK